MAKRGRPRHPGLLTPAEERVLEHVREGLPNAEIAVRLGISVNTVRYHVSNLLAKAGAGSREELARWRPKEEGRGWRWGWLSLGLKPAAVGVVAIVTVAMVGATLALLVSGDESAQALKQPDMREVESGDGWRLLVADDGKPLPGAADAILAIKWDGEDTLVSVLDTDGRIALQVETEYRPMAVINETRDQLIISDQTNVEVESVSRVLVFDLDNARLSFETSLPVHRVNYIVYHPHIALTEDGSWLAWNGSRAECALSDGTIASHCYTVRAVSLESGAVSDWIATMPPGCSAPELAATGPTAFVARCSDTRTADQYAPGEILALDVNNETVNDATGIRAAQSGWKYRGGTHGNRALTIVRSGRQDADYTNLAIVNAANGQAYAEQLVEDLAAAIITSQEEALLLRNDGTLERMNLVDGTSIVLPFSLPLDEWGETVLVR